MVMRTIRRGTWLHFYCTDAEFMALPQTLRWLGRDFEVVTLRWHSRRRTWCLVYHLVAEQAARRDGG